MYINKFSDNGYTVIEKSNVESVYGDNFEDINKVMKTCLPEEIEVIHYYKEPIYDVYLNGELRKSNLKEKEMHMYIDLMNLLNKEKVAL
ncbi:hypothetical protein JY665_14250 [Staphylococcus aureus]|uniref:hypothetical protein n=1 Tax=Staphylococcus TaxID=1279 RepID=UPI0004492919|nr:MULTISPECIES: hypothetical protein [Staphylococcus]EVJ48881.1 hypothetical protein U042_02796 [Staphylococcus aureus UCIM6147]MBG3203050.1 hypothetical protein [Staphylococcus aureus]MBN5857124.1 hypothetical protein [Staphylococcus aureus]MBN5917107.1 hypothetical protein [Staphylococcus aureus]